MGSSTRPTYLRSVSQTLRRSLSSNSRPHVVVIFGHTGVGISSLVNLIMGYPCSIDHGNVKPRTAESRAKPYLTPDGQFCLYEVPGFSGQPSDAKILKTIQEIEESEGIDLFIYCLRKLRSTILPRVVQHIRGHIAGADVPMIAAVTELERFEAEGGMEAWWDALIADGGTNGSSIERLCFGEKGGFEAHACITTLPPKEVALHDRLQKRRDISEVTMRRLIEDLCRGDKRRGSNPAASQTTCHCLSMLFGFSACSI